MASEICATAAGSSRMPSAPASRSRGSALSSGVAASAMLEITALVSRAARMSFPHTGASVATAHTGSPVSA
jgi:hypothetical protein